MYQRQRIKKVIGEPISLNNAFSGRKYYEAFDCPMCGCQNIVNTIEGEMIE
nr:MAG TPA: Transcription elongation factor Elf1 like [Caudoviricetes sp.]